MLNNCPACNGTISDLAPSCPHCGHPVASNNAPHQPKSHVTSTFTILAALGFVICLFTPRIIVALPIFGTAICAVIALFRKEQARILALILLILTIGLLFLSSFSTSPLSASSDQSSLSAVKIEDWNWASDPTFGTKGVVRWNVEIRNLSDRYIESVKVELTTYDKSGKLIATDFTYVDAIPPHDTRSKEGLADYYGTEDTATLKVAEVRFAR